MPPKPLSTVASNARFTLLTHAVEQRPGIAVAIMKCIALWAVIESEFSELFVTILASNKEMGASLWNEFGSDTSKRHAFRSICVSNLQKQDYDIINGMLKMIKSQASTRNIMAHGVYGISEEITDGIIVVDSRRLTVIRGKMEDCSTFDDKLSVANEGIPKEYVFVYKEKDLDVDLKQFYKTLAVMHDVKYMIRATSPERDRLRAELTQNAHLKTFLSQKSEDSQ